jgi:penicillin-binding protein 1C
MKLKPLFNKVKLKVLTLSLFAILSFVCVASIGGFIYFYIFKDLPSPYSLKDYKAIPISSQIYDRNGKLLYEVFRDENRTPIILDSLPQNIKDATIAIEDKDFYRHGGISIVSGILRALRDSFQTNKLQGGSTITQQLVKSALLTPERTIQRKIKEIYLAVWVEQIFTKNEILEMYLNQVPYGGSSYGIVQAAKTYYNTKPQDLTLAESALLSGLPQAPTLYSPHTNPDKAKTRRNTVLSRMYEQQYITKEEYEKAKAEPVKVLPPVTNIKAPHFVFEVKNLLEKEYGLNQLEEGGLRVTTTLDLDIQMKAEEEVLKEITSLEKLRVTNGAVLVTRPPTGEILAMVGSVNYFDGTSGAFNVTTAKTRQPGSSIKPVNYAVGIDRGIVTASTMFLDVYTCFPNPGQKSYCPKNYDNQFHGMVQLRYALANSYNIPAVKMLAFNGLQNFVASSSAFLISSFKNPDDYGLALTLGGGEVPMTEMAQAYSAFANRGIPRKLNYVLKVEDKSGKILYEFKDPNFVAEVKEPVERPNTLVIKGNRAISDGTAFIISHILQDNDARTPSFGARSDLYIPGKTVAVKTGTTNDIRDNWTIGYTPNFLVAVWVGNNDFTPMAPGIASGLTGASPIWNGVMKFLLENQPDLPLIKPDTVVGLNVCSDTGIIANKNGGCPTRFEYLIKGTNAKVNVTRQQVPVNRETGEYLNDPSNPVVEMQEKTILRDIFSNYCVDCTNNLPTPKAN